MFIYTLASECLGIRVRQCAELPALGNFSKDHGGPRRSRHGLQRGDASSALGALYVHTPSPCIHFLVLIVENDRIYVLFVVCILGTPPKSV